MFHVGKDYKKKGERYYKIAPITSHIIVIATENSTAPINSNTSLVLSDIVNGFKLMNNKRNKLLVPVTAKRLRSFNYIACLAVYTTECFTVDSHP